MAMVGAIKYGNIENKQFRISHPVIETNLSGKVSGSNAQSAIKFLVSNNLHISSAPNYYSQKYETTMATTITATIDCSIH